MEELKERLNILVDKEGRNADKEGRNADRELTLELILQVAKLNENLERGIVCFEGGPAEDVDEDE